MITRLSERLAGLQATWTFIAIGMFVAVLLFVQRASDLRRYQWTFFFIGAALLVLPMLPGLGRSVGGARIWVNLGPITFQPGEFAKLCLALFFAGYLADRRELIAAGTWKVGPLHLPEPRYLLPIVIAWGFSVMVMISQRDLGSSLLFFALFVVMLWVATEKAAYLWIGTVLFAFSATLAYFAFGHVQTRVQIWLDPWSTYDTKGYQLAQSMFSIAGGGTSGTGLGLGVPNRIPAAQTDFIFAAISEELGLVGATGVLIAFMLLDRGRAAHRDPGHQPVLQAAGHGSDDDHRRPGVHHHRRRDPGRAADRDHVALRQLRRQLAAGQLRVAGVADPDQRLYGPPPARGARHTDDR